MDYKNEKCGSCIKYRIDLPPCWGDEYYCDKDGHYLKANCQACSQYVPRPEEGYKRAGIPWHIVIIALALGSQSNASILKSIFEGDHKTNGTTIEESSKEATSNDLYNRFVEPCLLSLKENNLDEATLVYDNMLQELSECYGLELAPNNTKDNTRSRETKKYCI